MVEKYKDVKGTIFGDLTVISDKYRVEYGKDGRTRFAVLIRCKCGQERQIFLQYLTHKNGVKSCTSCAKKKHEHIASPEYTIWANIKSRCFNKFHRQYPKFGGAGITMCERWLTYENFREDVGPRPSENHHLARKDPFLGYDSKNCYWEVNEKRNQSRRNSTTITYKGQTLKMREWAEKTNLPFILIRSRHYRNWTPEEIFNTPYGQNRKK